LSDPLLSEALQLLLRELTTRFPPEIVDGIWVFAPREIAGRESGLVVLTLTEVPAASVTKGAAESTIAGAAPSTTEPEAPRMTEPAAASKDDRRQLVTWRYEATRERGKLRRVDTITEQGRAPRDRIPRLIEGVLARLGEAAETPLVHAIAGDPGRWGEFLLSVGILPVDPPYEE
jgi:hypothetical protein